jgi:hypothetical protein
MKHKPFNLKITLGILVITLGTFSAFSYVVYNYTPIVFDGGDGLGYGLGDIEGDISQGAVYFLEAYGNFITFMKQLEASGTSVMEETGVMVPLDQALKALGQAQMVYWRLKATADRTPYDTAVIERLKRFDYDGFSMSRELNPGIFAEVKNYLVRGEVRELYGRAAQEAARLLERVRAVKAKMEEGVSLPIEETWRANDLFMRFLSFGQYTAEVFKALQ